MAQIKWIPAEEGRHTTWPLRLRHTEHRRSVQTAHSHQMFSPSQHESTRAALGLRSYGCIKDCQAHTGNLTLIISFSQSYIHFNKSEGRIWHTRTGYTVTHTPRGRVLPVRSEPPRPQVRLSGRGMPWLSLSPTNNEFFTCWCEPSSSGNVPPLDTQRGRVRDWRSVAAVRQVIVASIQADVWVL